MTYTIPPPPADPKPRMVKVTDPETIAAIQRAGFGDPVGTQGPDGHWYAEAHSLRQWRGEVPEEEFDSL